MNTSAIERAENIITDDVTSQTRAAYNATKFRQEKERIERNFQIAKSNLDEVRLDVALRARRLRARSSRSESRPKMYDMPVESATRLRKAGVSAA